MQDHLDKIYELEKASYPEDEAATYEKLNYRLLNANDIFRGYFRNGELIGFVCGTKTANSVLTHDSMSKHDDDGRVVCIHSVVVASEFRRRGVGKEMLSLFMKHLKDNNLCEKVLLISKPHLIKFYESVGFKLNGESDVVHGQEKWYELQYDM